jgi:hypothetical protein
MKCGNKIGAPKKEALDYIIERAKKRGLLSVRMRLSFSFSISQTQISICIAKKEKQHQCGATNLGRIDINTSMLDPLV